MMRRRAKMPSCLCGATFVVLLLAIVRFSDAATAVVVSQDGDAVVPCTKRPPNCGLACPFGFVSGYASLCVCSCLAHPCTRARCEQGEQCQLTADSLRAECMAVQTAPPSSPPPPPSSSSPPPPPPPPPQAEEEVVEKEPTPAHWPIEADQHQGSVAVLKSGVCPLRPGGACRTECVAHADCRGSQLCCPNGCGSRCVDASSPVRALPVARTNGRPNGGGSGGGSIGRWGKLPSAATATFRAGTCPEWWAVERHDCDSDQCHEDADCGGVMKCCENACARRVCSAPIKSTDCIHLASAVSRLPEAELADGWRPACDARSGLYSVLQCNRLHCWCVDEESGLEMPGTRLARSPNAPSSLLGLRWSAHCSDAENRNVECELRSLRCANAAESCPHGVQTDERGCAVADCRCRDLCADVSCALPLYVCQLVEPQCARPPCRSVPKCMLNPCPTGAPRRIQPSGVTALCSTARQCAPDHWCHTVGYSGLGFCCPMPEAATRSTGECPPRTPRSLLMEEADCVSECRVDADCSTAQKCCFDGCALRCVELNLHVTVVAPSSSSPLPPLLPPISSSSVRSPPLPTSSRAPVQFSLVTPPPFTRRPPGGTTASSSPPFRPITPSLPALPPYQRVIPSRVNGFKHRASILGEDKELSTRSRVVIVPVSSSPVPVVSSEERTLPSSTTDDNDSGVSRESGEKKENGGEDDDEEEEDAERQLRPVGECPRQSGVSFSDASSDCSRHVGVHECETDADCEWPRRCCSQSCARVCLDPIRSAPCASARSAWLRLRPSVLPKPRCAPDGTFAPVQRVDSSRSWCVHPDGAPVYGTFRATKSNECQRVPCASLQSDCRLSCPHGYDMDTNGCAICSCLDVCRDIGCPSGFLCLPYTADCDPSQQHYCRPTPTCMPNVCPTGASPLIRHQQLMECGRRPRVEGEEAMEGCPPEYDCVHSGFMDVAYCCAASNVIRHWKKKPVDGSGSGDDSDDEGEGEPRCRSVWPQRHSVDGSPCTIGCSSDRECAAPEAKCCYNGCGTVCSRAIFASVTSATPPSSLPSPFQFAQPRLGGSGAAATAEKPAATGMAGVPRVGECGKVMLSVPPDSSCEHSCTDDHDCAPFEKCCPSSCGKSCSPPSVATPCIHLHFTALANRHINHVYSAHHHNALLHEAGSAIVPQCQPDGSFRPVQVDAEHGVSWCVDVRTGREIASTRRKWTSSSELRVDCSVDRRRPPSPSSEGTAAATASPCESSRCVSGLVCVVRAVRCLPSYERSCPSIGLCEPPICGLPSSSPLSPIVLGCWSDEQCNLSPMHPTSTRLVCRRPSSPTSSVAALGQCCPLERETDDQSKRRGKGGKVGECPHFPPGLIKAEDCARTCEEDEQCADTAKCCVLDGCSTACVPPVNATNCVNLRASLHLTVQRGAIVALARPQCTWQGLFERRQCADEVCWCVDPETGRELDATRRPLASPPTPACRPLSECTVTCEESVCLWDVQRDALGCPLAGCYCLDPCQSIQCPPSQTCMMRDASCGASTTSCLPIPTCEKMLCPHGVSLHPGRRTPLHCSPSSSSSTPARACPTGSICSEHGVCCIAPTVSPSPVRCPVGWSPVLGSIGGKEGTSESRRSCSGPSDTSSECPLCVRGMCCALGNEVVVLSDANKDSDNQTSGASRVPRYELSFSLLGAPIRQFGDQLDLEARRALAARLAVEESVIQWVRVTPDRRLAVRLEHEQAQQHARQLANAISNGVLLLQLDGRPYKAATVGWTARQISDPITVLPDQGDVDALRTLVPVAAAVFGVLILLALLFGRFVLRRPSRRSIESRQDTAIDSTIAAASQQQQHYSTSQSQRTRPQQQQQLLQQRRNPDWRYVQQQHAAPPDWVVYGAHVRV